MKFHTTIALGLVAMGLAGICEAATTYRAEMVTNYADDRDAADGFDYNTVTGATVVFTLTDSLAMTDNGEWQDGSQTDYSGVIFDEVILHTTSGDAVLYTNVEATMQLWDRADYGSQNISFVDAVPYADPVNPPSFNFDITKIDWLPPAAAPDLFNVGTGASGPGTFDPNTLIDGKLPTFVDTAERDTKINSYSGNMYSDGSGFAEGGLGFDIQSLVVVPEPASIMLLGLGGLAILGRKRG
ncbi:hypothetical protein KS4_07980 [Poriferisphaera corsica]|uniref:Ice-binding protein C-terminal domain-containing protein n=1 Tax=Poriferisphaera corsica TaxID=2528020 RepID=A0A517YRD0_9BACT|nr:PEP-CTERM sorting domain-containing protein [Poriferisphaera corsica]QDU32764.1 hypothetical protein KS4_07980 [Poriferisphaera corsica]